MPRLSLNDLKRLGPELATTKASMDPKQWRAIVKYAHKRGYTVGSVLSNAPDALKQRLDSSLRKEAKRTTDDAYSGAFKVLDEESRRQDAIQVRRQSDEQAYAQWVATQQQALLAQATASDNMLAQRQQEIASAALGDIQKRQEGLRADAAAQPGRVSDPSQSTALDMTQQADQAKASVNAAQQQSLSNARGGVAQLAALMAASLAAVKADGAVRVSEGQGRINDIKDKRLDLTLEKGKAYSDSLNDLRQSNVDKAVTQQNTDIAADKLGVQRDELAHKIDQDDKNYRLNKKKLSQQDLIEKAKIDLGYDKLAASKGKAAADRKLKLRVEAMKDKRASQKKGRSMAAERRAGRAAANDVSTVLGELDRIANGRTESGKKITGTARRDHLRKKGASDLQIDVANDLFHSKSGKLSERGRRKAKALGITDGTLKALGWI